MRGTGLLDGDELAAAQRTLHAATTARAAEAEAARAARAAEAAEAEEARDAAVQV